MAVELRIPESGESISEVQVGEWRKSEGDAVEEDEVLVEIETDKAAMDLPSPARGVLKQILKKQGEEAAPGDVIAYIEDGAAAAKDKKPKEAEKKEEKPAKAEKREKEESARKEVRKEEPSREEEEPAEAVEVEEKPREEEPRIMPAARRLIEEHDLDASEVEATGPGGRLLKEDVLRHLEKAPAEGEKPAPERKEARKKEAPPEPSREEGREEQIVAMSPMRKVIARNLVRAQQTAALLTTFNEVDMSAVIDLRKIHQESFQKKHGIKLGFMSFFVKASIEALKLVPTVNAEIRGENVAYRNYFDIGIAVGGGRGLVVPVLRNAERMSFAEIELAIADFAARAKKNQLELYELQGGTFTISNGGIYGSMLSTPIVNHPQSGILGLHRIQDRPMAVNGEVVVRPIMYLALTYDHRIVDGREAVTFLRHIKEVVEDPVRILIEI